MQKILIFLLILVLAGCSTWNGSLANGEVVFDKPRIHLFVYNDSKLNSDKYINTLRSAGYEVTLRNGDLPEKDEISFIIHSPGLNPNHFSEIENIVEILKLLGIRRINKYEYQRGKHSYTSQNVGVYLL